MKLLLFFSVVTHSPPKMHKYTFVTVIPLLLLFSFGKLNKSLMFGNAIGDTFFFHFTAYLEIIQRNG